MNRPVQTNALTKHYGRIAAVDDLTLTVEPGEVYGFAFAVAGGWLLKRRDIL